MHHACKFPGDCKVIHAFILFGEKFSRLGMPAVMVAFCADFDDRDRADFDDTGSGSDCIFDRPAPSWYLDSGTKKLVVMGGGFLVAAVVPAPSMAP